MTRFLLSFVLIFSLAPAAAEHNTAAAGAAEHADTHHTPSAEQMIVDGLIYRPLSLAGTLIGAGLFIVTLPFSAIGGNVDEAGQKLVVEPATSTFDRCLGCLPDYSQVNYHQSR